MKVLIACEFSGIVRDAFLAAGHEAVSCDLEETERPGPHIVGDVRVVLRNGWDLMIAHPPCDHLAVSGARWFKEKREAQQDALDFFARLWCAPIPRICIENPVSVAATWIAPSTQTIQPHWFGHGEVKATCLWLKNLPTLRETHRVEGRVARVHREPPGPNRKKNRSRTYAGIAYAMAQ